MSRRSYVEFSVEGKVWELAVDELSIALVKECRRATTLTPVKLVNEIAAGNGDIDYVAALIWMARRQAGEQVTLDQVEGSLSYATDVKMRFVSGATEDSDSPEG